MIGAAALVVVLLTLLRRGDLIQLRMWAGFRGGPGPYSRWSPTPVVFLLTVLLGAAGLFARWSWTPVAFLLLLVWLIVAPDFFWNVQGIEIVRAPPRPRDLILGAAVLTFLAAHYRLLGLTRRVLPAEATPRRGLAGLAAWLAFGSAVPAESCRRSPALVNAEEVLSLFLAVGSWSLLAYLVTARLPQLDNPLDLPPGIWHAVLVLWVLIPCFAVARFLVGYLHLLTLSRAEARFLLEEELWHAARGEQRYCRRWLARVKLHRRRKEPS
jgi:hypothetical protein